MAMSAPRRLLLSVAMLALVLSAGIVYELYRLKSARQFNAALEHNAFLEVNQASARGRFATAYGLQQLGEFEEAIRAYAEVEPDDAETAAAVRFNLANLYLRRALVLEGDENRDLVIPLIELAKENYRELLRRDSQHWDAKYNLELALALLPDLEQLPCGSQLGLAIFTEHRSFLLFSPVEVCDNYTAISAMLDKVDWRMAWAARSEVAKGLYSSLSLAGSLGKETRVIFLTDGHEAPPVHPEFRPQFFGTPGEISGAIIAIGGPNPMPIPRLNNEGKVVGNWTARQVLQVDTYSLGRGANVEAEPMVGVDMSDVARRIAAGTEHLSSLREVYLQRLARETRLDYFRPETPQQLANWLTQAAFANHKPTDTDLRWVPGRLATLSRLLAYVTVPAFRRTRSV